MVRQLHILTSPPDTLATGLLEALRRDPKVVLDVADLNEDSPDYPALVERVFAADTVATW